MVIDQGKKQMLNVKLVHQYKYMCNGLIEWKKCFFGTIFSLCLLLKYYICLSCSYCIFYINAVLTVKAQITMTIVLFKTPWPRTKGWIVRRDKTVDLVAYSLQIAKEWMIGPWPTSEMWLSKCSLWWWWVVFIDT